MPAITRLECLQEAAGRKAVAPGEVQWFEQQLKELREGKAREIAAMLKRHVEEHEQVGAGVMCASALMLTVMHTHTHARARIRTYAWL